MDRSVYTAVDAQQACFREDLQRELLKLLFATTPVVLVTNLINGTLIAGIFLRTNEPDVVATWWVLLVLMVAGRWVLFIHYKRDEDNRKAILFAIIGSGTSGVLWGAAGLILYSPAGETQHMVLGLFLGGMGAGAVAALTPCLPAFYAYLFPSLLPFLSRLALEGDIDHLTMAASCVLYLVALVLLGQKANMWLVESLLRRFENAELIRSLESRVEERTTELKGLNEQLHRDIAERRRAEVALADYGHRQAAIADFGQIALSGIDLQTLFNKAVVLVRDRLAVAHAAVIEEGADGPPRVVRAVVGLESARSPPEGRLALTDHPQPAICDSEFERRYEGDVVDQMRHAEPARIAEALISCRDREFGVLRALDVSPRQFSANDIAFLKSIANMLAAAIERKRAEHDIQQLAMRDPLTGLPNRSLFRNQLHQELARSKRPHSMLAVLLLDLDHFKDVNDTLGHPIGDRLLAAAAGRMKACLRETDAPARLGGDEFAVILSDLRSPEDAALVARKLVNRLSEPFVIDSHEIHIGASLGITISPCDAADVDGLLRTADLALYRAKLEGRYTYKFYATYMTAQVEARKTLENDLRHALKRDELLIEYQPQFELMTRRLTGAEALLRWRHPTRGLLQPDDFVPIAESTGLIVPLGLWVLDRVAGQMREWREAQLAPILVAVNISLSQCRRGDLVKAIADIATRTDWDLGQLELEVTEQLFLPQGLGDCVSTLRRLSSLGVTISIDDFGTGYSSLGRLRSLPVAKVKIDRSFVAELGINRDAEMIVRAIIALARSLGMTVTAEGVENDQQLTFLSAEGCDFAQGYHLSVPLSQHEFATMLRNNSADYVPLSRADCFSPGWVP